VLEKNARSFVYCCFESVHLVDGIHFIILGRHAEEETQISLTDLRRIFAWWHPKHSSPNMCCHAKFDCSRSDHVGINRAEPPKSENAGLRPLNNRTLCVPPFTVIQGHHNRHGSIGYITTHYLYLLYLVLVHYHCILWRRRGKNEGKRMMNRHTFVTFQTSNWRFATCCGCTVLKDRIMCMLQKRKWRFRTAGSFFGYDRDRRDISFYSTTQFRKVRNYISPY